MFCLLAGAGPEAAQAKQSVSVSAESAIVMDVQSGTILYEKNIDKKEYPASITKIMTALVALENSSLSETVTYSKEAVTNLEMRRVTVWQSMWQALSTILSS
jgi:D-alanyl-D-alanine carboxypeptidase